MKHKNIKLLSVIFLTFFAFKTFVLAETIDCEALGRFREDLQNIFNFVKILIPLLIVGLSVFDFIKAITIKDAKDLKTAGIRLLKRIVLAFVFFLLPTLINLLLDAVGFGAGTCIE